MRLVKDFIRFISDAKPVTRIAELEPGRGAAEGVVRIGTGGGITSPVKGRSCVAFYYKAFHFVGSRSGQMMPRKLRAHEVYHPFELELEDGRILARPKKSDSFTASDHKALSGHGYQGFKAVEDLLLPGTKVRVYGVVKRVEDSLEMVFTKLEVVTAEKASEKETGKKAAAIPKKRKKSKSAHK